MRFHLTRRVEPAGIRLIEMIVIALLSIAIFSLWMWGDWTPITAGSGC